jgi:hypothetical protein
MALLTQRPSEQSLREFRNLGKQRSKALGQLFAGDSNRFLTNQERAQDQLQDLMNRPADLSSVEGYTNFLKLQLQANPQNQAAILQAGLPQLQALRERKDTLDDAATKRKAFVDFVSQKFPDNENIINLARTGVLNPSNVNELTPFRDKESTLKGVETLQDAKGVLYYSYIDQGTGSPVTVSRDGSYDSRKPADKNSKNAPSLPLRRAPVEQSLSRIEDEEEIIKNIQLRYERELAEVKSVASINEFKEKDFLKVQGPALLEQSKLRDQIAKTQEVLQLVDSMKTGGPIQRLEDDLRKFLGIEEGDRADLEYELAIRVLEGLKDTFGGIISDSERTYSQEINANISRGNAANRQILQSLLDVQRNAFKRNSVLIRAKSYDEYKDNILNLPEIQLFTPESNSNGKPKDYNDL